MNTCEIILAVVVNVILGLFCGAGIDYMVRMYGIRSREKSWEDVYREAKEDHESAKEREA